MVDLTLISKQQQQKNKDKHPYYFYIQEPLG